MRIYCLLLLLLAISCNTKKETELKTDFNEIAERYVRLGLLIGQYDADFVDAYYGPDSLKPVSLKAPVFPKDSLIRMVKALFAEAAAFEKNNDGPVANRAKWLKAQLVAFERRIRIFSGETSSFDEESKDLFGVVAPERSEAHFRSVLTRLDSLLPGEGHVAQRFQSLVDFHIIPKDRIDTIFKASINESRKRTNAHYALPSGEKYSLEFVSGQPWSGYNWYKGNYTSLIQINTDLPVRVERALDVAAHESYPGHHVYNMLLEKHLYREKGWVEISLYPLFSPMSLIAEGSANYGIEVAFPGKEKNAFVKKVLLPLAGIDTGKLDIYFSALELMKELAFVRNEVARSIIDKKIDEKEGIRWLMEYSMNKEDAALKSVSFIRKYRSYVINYNYGQQLVKNYVESRGGLASDPEKRWKIFADLLSNQVTTDQLINSN